MTILGDASDAAPSADDREQIGEWASELEADETLLGNWFFPPDLVDFLEEHDVTDVVLVPDPRHVHVPYSSLKPGGRSVSEFRWRLSIAGSALDIARVASRYAGTNAGGLAWFAPDEEVNRERGGNIERRAVAQVASMSLFRFRRATVAAAVRALGRGAWLHFRGHGAWDPGGERGPCCFDGVLTQEVLARAKRSGAVMVTMACGTGFAEPVGTEAFGSLADYAAVGLRAAILTLWPIDSRAATLFATSLYRSLATGCTLGVAFRAAVEHVRTTVPHPFFWAPFVLVGDWSVRLGTARKSSRHAREAPRKAAGPGPTKKRAQRVKVDPRPKPSERVRQPDGEFFGGPGQPTGVDRVELTLYEGWTLLICRDRAEDRWGCMAKHGVHTSFEEFVRGASGFNTALAAERDGALQEARERIDMWGDRAAGW
jgi:hypothetical protein